MTFALIMPAAGSGSRFGCDIPKTLIEISGKPLFIHSILPFLGFSDCLQVIIAAPAPNLSTYREALVRHLPRKDIQVVCGGATRQDSVGLALAALTSDPELVLVHDAARPLIKPRLIQRVCDAMLGPCVAAIPALPVTDTIKRATGQPSVVLESVDRDGLFAVQTPQALLRKTAIQAHDLARKSGFQGTDDASLIEEFRLGEVFLVDGDPENIKLTTRKDLDRVRELL